MTFSATALTAFATAAAAASATNLSSGTLELLDSGNAVLVSFPLGTPTSSGAVTTMAGFPKNATAGASGTVASGRYRTSGATDWKTGMTTGLSGSGAQIILTSLSVSNGQIVTINSATLNHSAT